MVQPELHLMRGPDRFPRFPFQEREADASPESFKTDLCPETCGFFIPRDPGVFLLFRLSGRVLRRFIYIRAALPVDQVMGFQDIPAGKKCMVVLIM